MTTDRHDEKDGGKNSKLSAGLKKLPHDRLVELNRAVTGELERRAKEAKNSKKPSEMSDRDFNTWAAKEISKHSGDDNDE
jgi:hypothetical protein